MVVPRFVLAAAVVAETDLILTLPERVAREIAADKPLRILLPLKLAPFDVQVAWHDRVLADPAVTWRRGQVLAVMRGA